MLFKLRSNYFCAAFLFAALLCASRPLPAQYFGQNKVQYENFKFKILKTDHFDVYFYPEEAEAAAQAARMAERWYARQQRILQHELAGRQTIIFYASHPHFEQTNVIGGGIGEGTGGVTEALRRRVVLPFAGPIPDTDHVIGHELVHAFQYDITGVNTGGAFRSPRGLQLPLWFIEGMAELLSLGTTDAHTAMWMRDAVQQKKLPSFRQLDDPRFFPYRYGHAFLAYVAGRLGDGIIGDLLKVAGSSANIEGAIRQVLATSPDSLMQDWQKALQETYAPLLQTTAGPETYGKQIIGKRTGAGELNIAPVLSPDGKQIIFFSERDLFSIDLFLANAETGEIERNLVHADLDPHYESLGFISSAGAWEASGQRLAFAQVTKGRPGFSVLDVRHGEVVREFRFKQLGEIFNPTWSPDGRYLAFSALANGMSDLCIFDLETENLRRVTEDFYSDLHPAWSPDGRHIVFASDRFTADLEILKPGDYRLALYEVASGKISALPAFAQGKHLNPQWSPDGRSIYFISDRDGIANVYRLARASGEIFQITNLFTGVTGITATSPALSVAQKANVLAFSVFQKGEYNIYRVEAPEALAGKLVAPGATANNAAALPPLARRVAALDSALHNWTVGLSNATGESIVPYRSKLALSYISQPSLAIGVDSYGAQFGGGISFLWTDILGDHTLGLVTQAQIQGGFNDFAAQAGYTNFSRRWNWGASIQQIPYIVSQFAAGIIDSSNDRIYIEQELRYRQLNREISGGLAYPFSRVQRLEFSLGYQRLSFDRQLRTVGVSLTTGREVIDDRQDLSAPGTLNLANANLALVYDTSIFGATSPIVGQRYRVEASPYAGTLTFNSILADYRRYFMPVRPFTLAGRVLHYGRYGRDAEDGRLADLFIGYPGLVRGYDSNSFEREDFVDGAGNNLATPVYDRLFGSRLALANFELRFPLFGALGLGSGYYGVFPLETGVFYDLGVAWTRAQEASFLGGARDFVRSYGAVMRINLLGFAILEFDFVKPVDRPQKGWFWQFNFTAGF